MVTPRTPEIDIYAPAMYGKPVLTLEALIACLWERVEVLRQVRTGPVPLGSVDELLEQARPFVGSHALVLALVQELEAHRA